jgi:mannose-6-phosphate isomerase-like protein (cupin superfamily)
MRAGDIVHDGDETFIVTRSASEGGRFCFEVKLGPGTTGPPAHSHEEPEDVEILSGEVIFTLEGKRHHLKAGDRLAIPPRAVHSFRNPSRTTVCHARGSHGARFERLVDQLAAGPPAFTRLARYLTEVDPYASRMRSPLVRLLLHAVALTGRLRRVRIVG